MQGAFQDFWVFNGDGAEQQANNEHDEIENEVAEIQRLLNEQLNENNPENENAPPPAPPQEQAPVNDEPGEIFNEVFFQDYLCFRK